MKALLLYLKLLLSQPRIVKIKLGAAVALSIIAGVLQALLLVLIGSTIQSINSSSNSDKGAGSEVIGLFLHITQPTHVLIFFAIITYVANVVALHRFLKANIALTESLYFNAFQQFTYASSSWHISSRPSEILTILTVNMDRVVGSISFIFASLPSLIMAAGSAVGIYMLSPIFTAGIFISLSAYLGISGLLTGKSARISSDVVVKSDSLMSLHISDSIRNILQIKLGSFELQKSNIYRTLAVQRAKAQSRNSFITSFPKLSLDAIYAIGVCLLIEASGSQQVAAYIVPLMLAIQRIMPATNLLLGIYMNLQTTAADIRKIINFAPQQSRIYGVSEGPSFRGYREFAADYSIKSLQLKNVSYKYNNQVIISDQSLSIEISETTAIVGPSGSGKSTLLYLLSGILQPTSGKVLLNGNDLHSQPYWSLKYLHSEVVYVPQTVTLVSGNVIDNVAFYEGTASHDVDRIWHCLDLVGLANFVRQTQDGLWTDLGEDGRKLSGGQRQRLGVARAIYRNSEIIIMDEATSAIEKDLEKLVMTNLSRLGKTIVLVTHSPQLMQMCSRCYALDGGMIRRVC